MLNKIAMEDFADAIECLMRYESAKSCTVFCSPLSNVTQRVRATWQAKPSKKSRINEIRITFGRLNYAERQWLKTCKRAKCLPRRIWYGKIAKGK